MFLPPYIWDPPLPKSSFPFNLTPTPLLKERGYIIEYVCTTLLLLKERGYIIVYLCTTLLLLKEKEMEDEVSIS
jgi:hypothetical protein